MGIMKFSTLAAAALIGTAAPIAAQTYTFNTTGNNPDNGPYGDVLNFTATNNSSLQVKVTGWQANQSSNAITSAWVGAYSPGMGVTGLGDNNGANNYHQIDNAGGYTDFVLLQFNTPVAITSINLNSFNLGSMTTKDNDFAYYAANISTPAWNSAIDLSGYKVVPSTWTTVAGSGNDGPVSTGITTKSSQWLIGAAFNSGNNDGFKIASMTVNAAVPETATWAMMIVGMGLVGYSLRRQNRQVASPARLA